MKIHDCAQGSTEWLALRAGRPTASEFDNLITPLWKVRDGAGVDTYLYRKLAEKCMGVPMESGGGSFAMNNGVILEAEALPWFEFAHDVKVQRVGFVTSDDGRMGCSPDGLLGNDGGIEIKCPMPDTHLRYLLAGTVPRDYLAQVHGSMLVTGRAWWKFLVYGRQFPPLVVRVERDETIIAKMRAALDAFLARFDAEFARIQAIRDDYNAKRNAENKL